jgi:putative oxidoreductase
MLASMFVMGGVSALREPDRHVRMADPVVGKLSEAADKATSEQPFDLNEKQLVMINGGAQLAAGLALATGRLPRLSALVLAGSLVPTTLAGHRFWEEQDKTQRANQLIHFVKNVSMFGGLVIASADTEGRPGMAYRARSAAKTARREAKHLRREAKAQARLTAKSVTS